MTAARAEDCPSLRVLQRYVAERCTASADARVGAHVARCAVCEAILARVAQEPFLDLGPVPALAGYDILETLGHGGMGVVYRARQHGLNRIVALKFILSGAWATAQERARFAREAEMAARVLHSNVVQIYEIGSQQDVPYLVLEFVDGPTLTAHCGGGPQPPRWAAETVQTIALALAHIHACGVVHRDLKPGNVLLAGGRIPKVADFGLARTAEAGLGTRTRGQAPGTPQYMAPEVALGRVPEGNPAVDIYALGAILYELLTGRPPFLGETYSDILLQVIHTAPVPVRQLQPAVPIDLETICMKCLEKEPGQRYTSAAEVAEELQRYCAGEPIRARPAGALELLGRWCRRPERVAEAGVYVLVFLSILLTAATIGLCATLTGLVVSPDQDGAVRLCLFGMGLACAWLVVGWGMLRGQVAALRASIGLAIGGFAFCIGAACGYIKFADHGGLLVPQALVPFYVVLACGALLLLFWSSVALLAQRAVAPLGHW